MDSEAGGFRVGRLPDFSRAAPPLAKEPHSGPLPAASCEGVPEIHTLSSSLSSSKPLSWRGLGELPQWRWRPKVYGLVAVLDLWAGFSGALIALLALGIRVVAVAAESSPQAVQVARANFPNLIHIEWVESVTADVLRPLLARRKVSVILAGGGSPCQGNSVLNKKRKNLDDPRSQQPLQLARIYEEICAMPEVVEAEIEVLGWLEMVASATPVTKDQYSSWLGAERVRIEAKWFGWVERNRCFWGRSRHRSLKEADLSGIPNVELRGMDSNEPELRYTGAKPMPRTVKLDDGYTSSVTPEEVMRSGQGAIFPLTREFWHPWDRGLEGRVSAEAISRWMADSRRFPPGAYEAANLAWKGDQWRTWSPRERAELHGFPPRVVETLPVDSLSRAQVVAAQNSLIGNGFHLPSMMMFFTMLFTLVAPGASRSVSSTKFSYSPEEAALRGRVLGSVFQPGICEAFPGLVTRDTLIWDMRLQVPTGSVSDRSWAAAVQAISHSDLEALQAYWVDTQLRERPPSPQGPQWAAQTSRSKLPASLGSQRFPGDSRRGLDHLLQPGLGKERHIREALRMDSPFRPGQAIDDDVAFCARALALLGPFLPEWRRKQERSLARLARALKPITSDLRAFMSQEVRGVAGGKDPATMAALTTLLRWPDREQARHFVEGFQVLGDVPSAGVFRQLPTPDEDLPSLEDSFWGRPAEEALVQLYRTKPPKDHQEILKATMKEQSKGWLGPTMTTSQLNSRHGRGRWRFIPRFLLWQKLKSRLIDDAKRGGQNDSSSAGETIFTISVDWLGESVSAMCLAVAAVWGGLRSESLTESVLASLPDWFCPMLGLDDLPDAYRGCPVREADRPGCVVAFWDGTCGAWRFAESRALLFGLGAAVQAFNRLPTLVVATARRMLGACAGAYFDDIAVVGCASGSASDQKALHTLLATLGSPATPEKRAWMAQHRQWLGTACNLTEVTSTGLLYIKPKESAVEQVVDGVGCAVRKLSLAKAEAAKLRGQVGWTGSLSTGKCGRIGVEVLKNKQYRGPAALDDFDVSALIFLATVASLMPERRILVAGTRTSPILVYSDASFDQTSKEPPRLGWVLFDNGKVPEGRSLDVPWDMVASWMPRKTQIFPAEAFAVYAAASEHIGQLAGRDLVVFIDNEAAAAAMIRGSSSTADVGAMAQAVHWLLMRHDCRVWFEWIDSDSNPSDGLSRAGILDPWTLTQGWNVRPGMLPAWKNDLSQHLVECRMTLGLD